MLAGQRILNVEKCFNVREGATRQDDKLPHRLMNEVLPQAGEKAEEERLTTSAGKPIPVAAMINSQEYLDHMLDEYYALHGWDKTTGRPLDRTLTMLGLEDVARGLEGLGMLPKE